MSYENNDACFASKTPCAGGQKQTGESSFRSINPLSAEQCHLSFRACKRFAKETVNMRGLQQPVHNSRPLSGDFRTRELCESRGSRPGAPLSRVVRADSVEVTQH